MPTKEPTILATSMGFNRAREPWQASPIFRYAFELTETRHPRLCFVSTGTGDRQCGIDGFYGAFTDSLVETSHLALFDKPNVPDIAAHLLAQDAIWVDRGSLANLLAVWRTHNMDTILRECWERGIVLAGESAGSLCWFSGATTDSFGDAQSYPDGLGLLPFSNAVHYANRRTLFQECIANGELTDGYATDTGAGLHFAGTELVAAVSDRASAGAFHVTRTADGEVRESALDVQQLKR